MGDATVSTQASFKRLISSSLCCCCFYSIDRYKVQDHHDKDEKDLAFTNLVNHFGHLVTGPDSIADAIKKELQSRSVERDLAVMSDDRRKTFGSLELNIWEDICDVVPFSR